MKKFILSLIAATAVCTSAVGQTFMAAPQAQMYNAPMAEEDLTWLQLCNPNAQASGVGTQAEIELGAAAHFSTDVLSPYKGKEVSVVAICLNTPLTDATVFISEGEDINNATTVAEKTVGYLAGGWNYVQFDTPVTIGDVELSLGFKAIDTKNFPLAFDGQSAKTGGAYISTGGAPFVADSQFGNLMVRMLVDGDPAELENALTLSSVKGGIYQPQGTEIEYELNIANSTYNEVKNATVVWTLNGAENTEDITFDTPIAGNSLTTYNLSIGTLTESASLTFKITKVNGIDNKSIETISKSVRLYDPANTTERTILIEKFTGLRRPTVSFLVDSLVTRGLAVRNTSLSDRRMRTVTLTPQGDEVVRKCAAQLKDIYRIIGVSISSEELGLFSAVVEKLDKILELASVKVTI